MRNKLFALEDELTYFLIISKFVTAIDATGTWRQDLWPLLLLLLLLLLSSLFQVGTK